MSVIESRYGQISIPDDDGDVICRFITQYGEWAWMEVEFLAQFLPAGAKVLDLGAFLGTFSLGLGMAASSAPQMMCAVEANPLVMSFLRRNLSLSRATQTELIEALAVGDEPAPTRGRIFAGNLGATSFVAESAAADRDDALHVQPPAAAVTLAELRRRFGPFDLVKLDVEGMELEVLKGDAEHLSKGSTQIWLECNESTRSLEVCDLLLSWGLKVYYFAFPSFNQDNYAGDQRPIFPFAFEAGLLAAPRSTPVLSDHQRAAGCIWRIVDDAEELRRALWSTPRWGYRAWHGASVEKIVALAGREVLGQDYSKFLRAPNAVPGFTAGPDWAIPYFRHELAKAKRVALERQAELDAVQGVQNQLEASLASAERISLDRQAELDVVQQACCGLEASLAKAEHLASERKNALELAEQAHRELELSLAEAALLGRNRLAEMERERAWAADAAAELQAKHERAREYAGQLERQLCAATSRLGEAERVAAHLAAIEASTTWRVSARLRQLAEQNPSLRSAVRRLVRTAHSLRRRIARAQPIAGIGLLPDPSSASLAAPSAVELAAASSLFDSDYYCATYPDVAAAGVDPLHHYMTQGWREGRDPSSHFSTRYYLSAYPDVKVAGVNPLVHYAVAGATEARRPQRPMEELRRRLDNAEPPRQQAARWLRKLDTGSVLSAAALRAALAPLDDGGPGIILSVSHDDYVMNFGGVQNAIVDEAAAFSAFGWPYLHISPAQPLPLLADSVPSNTFLVSLRYNSNLIGLARMEDLIQVLARTRRRSLHVVVHHLLGHVTELLAELTSRCNVSGTYFWIHDFFSLCTSYTLIRNDLEFCGAPGPESPACRICNHGDERQTHLQRIRAFLTATSPTIIAPSATALSIWEQREAMPHAELTVVPLCELKLGPFLPQRSELAALKVGFLGARTYQKGWRVFEELARRHANDPRYAFVQLGLVEGTWSRQVRNVPVRVVPTNRNAMVQAVRDEGIDAAVIWSLWPETFSFIAHEALAGGAFVITNRAAGNVWPVVAAHDPARGRLAEGQDELFELFESGRIIDIVARSRPRTGDLTPGRGAADVLLPSQAKLLQLQELTDD